MAKILIGLLLVGCFARLGINQEFDEFLIKYKKVYSDEEYLYRASIFTEKLRKIAAHNADPKNTWTMGINEFSDWTREEFRSRKVSEPQDCSATLGTGKVINYQFLPTSVDWRDFGVVTPVKDQGNCGSCWAFSMTSALEHQYYKAKGKVVSLSDQQVASCTNSLTNGCNGYNPLLGIILILYILKQ